MLKPTPFFLKKKSLTYSTNFATLETVCAMQRIPSTNNKSCHYYGDYMPHRNRLNLANGKTRTRNLAQLCLIPCSHEAPQQLPPCHPKPRAPRHRGPMSQRLTPPRPRRRRRLPDTAPAAVTTVSFDDPGGPTRHALVRVDTGCSLKPSVPSSPYQHII